MIPVRGLLTTVLTAASTAAVAQAQVRASEPATISQTIDGTVITLEYSRPRQRGRSPIYGKEVPWGEVWTPGANWATTLEVSNPITLNGHPVPKGKYSVWMEVQPKTWTVILDTTARLFHTQHVKPDSSQVRFAVTPAKIKGPEVLAWSFPLVTNTSATLQMAWADRQVTLQVGVPPSAVVTMTEEAAHPFLGSFALGWAPRDSTGARVDSGYPQPDTWSLSYRDSMLYLSWTDTEERETWYAAMVRVGTDWFYPFWFEDGELWEASPNMVAEFEVVDGRATGFVIRNKKDEVIARGTRKE